MTNSSESNSRPLTAVSARGITRLDSLYTATKTTKTNDDRTELTMSIIKRTTHLRWPGRTLPGAIALTVMSALLALANPASAAKGRSDFAVVATTDQQLVVAGSSVAFDFSLRRTGGFRGVVSWSVKGLPAGATSAIATKRRDVFQLSVTAPATAPTAESTLVLTGRSGSKIRSRLLRLTVVARPAGAPAAGPVTTVAAPPGSVSTTAPVVTTAPAVTVAPPATTSASTPTSTAVGPKFELLIARLPEPMFAGETSSYDLVIDRSSGYQGPVTFSVSGLPPGSTSLFDPQETTRLRTKLSVIVAQSAPASTSNLTISATAGTTTKSLTTKHVIYRHPPSGQVVVRGFETDVLPGETFNVTVDVLGVRVDGGRIRVAPVYVRGSGNEVVVSPVEYLEVGNSLTFSVTAGTDERLADNLTVNSSRNSPVFQINVKPFTMRSSTKSFQVDRGKTVPIRFDISVAAGLDPALSMTLARSPLNPNLPVPTYEFRLGTGGKWIAEVTATRTAPLGKTIETFTLFTKIGTKIESVRVPIEIEVIDSTSTVVKL